MPTITELVTYVPSQNYETSKRFYAALGFEQVEGWGDSTDCSLGSAKFRLQNYYNKDWAENFMMKFDVPSVKEWHDFAKPIIENGNFDHAKIDPPEMVGDTRIMHVWDPCGVLLIFIESASVPESTVKQKAEPYKTGTNVTRYPGS